VKDRIHEISFRGDKKARYGGLKELLDEVKAALAERFPESEQQIASVFSEIERNDIRRTILEEKTRIGGRSLDEIRNITCELDILPAHMVPPSLPGEKPRLWSLQRGNKARRTAYRQYSGRI
jgi:polyribonucleotide nucleotidyltransferase